MVLKIAIGSRYAPTPRWLLSARSASISSSRNIFSRASPPFHLLNDCTAMRQNRCHFQTLEEVRSRLSRLEEPFHIPSLENVLVPKNYDEYHSIVYSASDGNVISGSDLVVSIFLAKQSTPSVSVVPNIAKLASEFAENRFLVIDADLVPRAAYDADLQQFPAVLLSFNGDLYRRLIQENGGYPLDWRAQTSWNIPNTEAEASGAACTLPQSFYDSTRNAIQNFYKKYNGKKVSSIKSKSGTHSYTHGIDTDNLNVKRVGWPTE